MAEESIDLMVTPEKYRLDGRNINKNSARNLDSLSNGHSTLARHHRASIGSYHAGNSSLRNSTEKSDSANSSQNVVPHYLRTSTGSCHDFCKYGREHSFEKKARKPLRKRIAKPLSNELYSVQTLVSGDQKKEKVVSHRPSTDTKTHSPDLKPSPDTKSYSPKPKTSLDKEKAMKHKRSKDTKTHSPDLKPSPDTKSYLRKPKTSLDKEKAMKHKHSKDTKNHSPDMPSPDTKSDLRKPKMPSDAKIYSPKQNSSSCNKTLLPKSKPSSTKKFPSADPPEIVKSVFFPSTEVEDSVKQGSSTDNKMSRAEKKTTYVSQQHSSPVKSKPDKVKPSSSDNSDGLHGKERRNGDAKAGKNLTASKAPAKKLLAAPAATLSPKLSMNKTARVNSGKAVNLKLVSPLKDRNMIQRVKTTESNDEKVSEKTLHVIKTETENNVSEASPGDNDISSLPSPSSAKSMSYAKSSSSTSSHEEDNAETYYNGAEADEFISDNNDSQEVSKVPPVKENHKKTLRKSRGVFSEDKYSSPVKLKFRIGKLVDLQSDNNGPRRLRFRRARVLGAEDSKGDLRWRTLKKAGVNDTATRAEASSEKVLLKHQDVQGKKDAQGLFNNVIEETASKLVESRKSKVKALVGAFETVISLQESKPSS